MQRCTINLKGKNPSFVDWQLILFFHRMTYLNFAQPGGTRSDQRKKRKTKLKMGFSMLIYVLKCLNFALHLRSWHANRAQSKLWNVTFLATKKRWWGCFGRYASLQHIYTLGETPSAVASWNKPKMKFCRCQQNSRNKSRNQMSIASQLDDTHQKTTDSKNASR